MKVTVKIEGKIEDIIASYEAVSSARCVAYATHNGYLFMELEESEPEPEDDGELLDMIKRAFDALSDIDALAKDRIADEVKRRVSGRRWGAYQNDE